MPSSGPAEPTEFATSWSVRPPAAGKSAAVTAWAARTFSRRPPVAGTCDAGSLSELSVPPQPASSTATASSARGSLPIPCSLIGCVLETAP